MSAGLVATRILPLWAQMHQHHAAEPPGFAAYVIVAVATVVVVWVLYLAVRMTISPGETDRSHIKWAILEEPSEHKDE